MWDLRTGLIEPIGHVAGGCELRNLNPGNSAGVGVGSSAAGWDGTPHSTEAVLWTAGEGTRPLGRLEDGSVLVSANAISDTGVIVGNAQQPGTPVREPFIGSPLEGY